MTTYAKVFPYCLERSTNVRKSSLNAIECDEMLHSAFAYMESIKRLQSTSASCVAALEHAYSVCQNPEILKAKRKMLANKPVTNQERLLNLACDVESVIEEYNSRYEDMLFAKNHYTKLFNAGLHNNRCAMQKFFKENEYVLKTLPLINKDFICKLRKYLEIPVEQHNAKIRKLDHQLVRLFTRATMKTSPFSFLTSVCLYNCEGQEETEERMRSICEINNYILKAIYDFIVKAPHFAAQITYRLNANKAYKDHYIFLYQRDYEKGKVYKTVDGTVKVNKKGVFELIYNQFKGSVFHFEEIVKLFTDHGMDSAKALEFICAKLIDSNVITAHVSIDDTKDDIYSDFYAKIDALIDDRDGTLKQIRHCVRQYEAKVKEFEGADWLKRFAVVNALDALILEIEAVLGRTFVHNILLYEDSIYEKPRKPVCAAEFRAYGMDKLQEYFCIFDQGAMTYALFSELFYAKYGDEQIPASDLDLYKLFVEAASKLTGVWKDTFSLISFEAGEKIKRISSLKKSLYALIQGLKMRSEPQDIKEFIDSAIDDNPDIFDADINSATFFFQKSEEGTIILNKVYKGQLLFFTRFLKLFSQNSEKVQQYCKHAFGQNPLEITESFGFNANVHRQVFEKRLVLNLTDLNDATDRDVSIDDCFFRFDKQKNRVILWNRELGEVNGVYLGSLALNLMPIPLRTIYGMQPTIRFDANYLNLWENSQGNELIADHIPRLQYGRIVLIREQYLLNSIYNLEKPAEELYLQILGDFIKAKLPLRFFVRPYINGEDFDFFNMGRTSLKPQYIDLSSPLLFHELLREMENQKQFILEEVYPDNSSDDYIFEYQMEQTLVGEHT